MRKLSQIVEAKELSLQDDTMDYASPSSLSEYLKIADKFISVEAKNIINWLISNGGQCKKEYGSLQKFYAKGKPKDPELQQLYKWIGVLSKKNRLMEVPVFQTEDQFESILNKDCTPDEILLDLSSARGKNEVVKKYMPLVWKIARQFNGKSRLTLDELYSVGLEGLNRAIECYGKSEAETRKNGKFKDVDPEEVKKQLNQDKEMNRKKYTFMSFAAFNIRIFILEAIKNESHLVRIPVSIQNKERKETGRNTKQTSVSGEDPIGGEDGDKKGIFGKIDSKEDADANLDREDIAKLWRGCKKILEKNFNEQQLDIFYSFYGIFGYEKKSAKELMKKYGLKNPSQISGNNWKVLQLIKTNKTLKNAFAELWSLYKECLNNEDSRNAEPGIYRVTEQSTAYVE